MFRLLIFNVFVERITVTPFCHLYSSYPLPLFFFVSYRETILICFIFLGGLLVISLLFLVTLLGLTVYIFNITLCGQMVFYLMHLATMDIHFSCDFCAVNIYFTSTYHIHPLCLKHGFHIIKSNKNLVSCMQHMYVAHEFAFW